MTAEPLLGTIQAVQFTDTELKRILHNASLESARMVEILDGRGTPSANLRSLQIQLANQQLQMWNSIQQATEVGIGDGVWNATSASAMFDEGLFAEAGLSNQYWRQALMASAAQGKESLISKASNGIPLSQNVYKTSVASTGKLQQTIQTGLGLGKTVAEIKKDVFKFVNPNTPGGASYAAQRLARTEVINAYHATAIRRAQESPWVETMIWNLSGSHKKPDECNAYAEAVEVKGGQAGEWPVNRVPAKPHPNCLCYVSPVAPDMDTFAKNFESGKYDKYIDGEMGCYRVA